MKEVKAVELECDLDSLCSSNIYCIHDSIYPIMYRTCLCHLVLVQIVQKFSIRYVNSVDHSMNENENSSLLLCLLISKLYAHWEYILYGLRLFIIAKHVSRHE